MSATVCHLNDRNSEKESERILLMRHPPEIGFKL